MAEALPPNTNDILIRSRQTVLELLQDRGYNIAPYTKLGPDELVKLVVLSNPRPLQIVVSKTSDPSEKAFVFYSFTRIKPSVGNIASKLLGEESADRLMNPDNPTEPIDPTKTTVIYLTMEQIADTFHIASLNAYNNHKLRLQFFSIPSLVNNPMKHYLQPKFEKIPTEEHDVLLKTWYAKSKTQLPMIRYHSDMVARYMGLVVGDIVKITSPSYSSGETILYRVCVP